MLEEKGLLAPVDAGHAERGAGRRQLAEGRLARASRPAAAVFVVQHRRRADVAAADVGARPGGRRRGRASSGIAPSETDFTPMVTADDQGRRRGRDQDLAGGAQGQRQGLRLQRGPDRPPSTRAKSPGGVIDHYYWYRMRDEEGAADVHSALHSFAAGRPGGDGGRLRMRGPVVQQAPGGGAGVARLPGSAAGAADHRHLAEL